MRRIIGSVVGIGVFAMAVTASAQSLADLAKKDTERRKTVKHPAKVYTNDDVQDVKPIMPMMVAEGKGPAQPAQPGSTGSGSTDNGGNPDTPGVANHNGAPAPAVSGGQTAGAAATAAPADKAPGAPGVKAGDEAQWRGRLQAARDAVSRTQLQLESMRNQAAQLTAASAAASDDQRSSFQKRQQDALQEYDKLRADLQRNQKALADLQSEASRAGVPPGWLR